MGNWRNILAVLAGVVIVGLSAGDLAQPVRAQISERPSQVPFIPRPGTSVPQGLEVLRVLGNVYVIAGAGGNVVLQTGDQGIFLVDTGSAAKSRDLLGAIKAISDETIRYIVNTTPEPDHYGGNDKVAQAGWSPTVPLPGLTGSGAPIAARGGDPREVLAMVIAHEGLLNRVSASAEGAAAVPFDLWPTNTFFTMKKSMSFNHEGIELRHDPAAHSAGDLVVFFRKSDVIAAGDLIDTGGYPKVDAAHGGSLKGLLAGLNDVIDVAIAEFNQQGGTRIVPGHGRVMNETDVADYRDMTTIVRDRVKVAIDKKMSLAETKALKPTLDYDGLYARPDWTGDMFVEAIYKELSQPQPAVRRP